MTTLLQRREPVPSAHVTPVSNNIFVATSLYPINTPHLGKLPSTVVPMEVFVSFYPIYAGLKTTQGLLVAACANRAPKGTFGAAVAEVGVLDMLKVHMLTIIM